MEFDLVCIGGGSAGLSLSTEASSFHKKIALIEKESLGGACLQKGCIPKKIMYQISSLFHMLLRDTKNLGINVAEPDFNWQKMVETRDAYISRVTNNLENRLVKDGIMLLKGIATIVAPGLVEITSGEASYTIKAKYICLTSGSEPVQLNVPGQEYLVDSNEFFNWNTQPNKVAIIGGGYIGTELTNLLQKLGTQTYLCLREEYPLPGFDHDIRKELSDNLKVAGTTILITDTVDYVEKNELVNKFTVSFNHGRIILDDLDHVICAIGRKPKYLNCLSTDLKTTIELHDNGRIKVDANYRTNIHGVYAIGDLIDTPNLTPVAIWQGRELARILFEKHYKKKSFPINHIPSAVFVYPTVATLGFTEEHALSRYGTEVKIFRKKFTPLYSSISNASYKCYMKLICIGQEEKIIGLHLVGHHAEEIIQGFSVAVTKGITRRDLNDAIALHPSLAEEILSLK